MGGSPSGFKSLPNVAPRRRRAARPETNQDVSSSLTEPNNASSTVGEESSSPKRKSTDGADGEPAPKRARVEETAAEVASPKRKSTDEADDEPSPPSPKRARVEESAAEKNATNLERRSGE